jgi:hypothetical protein
MVTTMIAFACVMLAREVGDTVTLNKYLPLAYSRHQPTLHGMHYIDVQQRLAQEFIMEQRRLGKSTRDILEEHCYEDPNT